MTDTATHAPPRAIGDAVPLTVPHWGPQDRSGVEILEGGVTAAGFRAAGVAAGLKPSGRPDVALVLASTPVSVAAVTTTNRVKAAPVLQTESVVQTGTAAAVVVNAGNANACTGPEGVQAAAAMAARTAEHLDVAPEDVVVMSTGVIGVPLPTDAVLAGIDLAVQHVGDDAAAGRRAAAAICTTDTVVKQVAIRISDEQGSCVIGGMIKGAGMIEPAMATMLGVITTDADVGPTVLQAALRQASAATFNRISVDACGSTNDTVVLLASGTAADAPSAATFQRGLEIVCADLAAEVVADGEATTKTVAIRVKGARTEKDAEDVARAVASSDLVRAAFAGADPNWGRVLAAMGAGPVDFEQERVTVSFGGVTVCRFGVAASFDRAQAANAMSHDVVEVVIDLGAGQAAATFLTADLTPGYVTFNSAYTT